MFKDKNLEKTIQYKVEKFAGEKLTKEDIEKVLDLDINNTNLRGEKLNVDISEILILDKLKSLSLNCFKLTDREIEILNSLRYFHITTYTM